MKLKILIRRLLVILLAALLILSLSFSAFADNNSFVFQLDKSFKIKDINLISDRSSCLSLKDALAWDLGGANGEGVAESIAHTLFLNEQLTIPEQDDNSGVLNFSVVTPAIFALAKDDFVESSSAYKIDVLALDIADGTKLRTELWQENSSDKSLIDYISCGSCLVKDGMATMTIGKKMIRELGEGILLKAIIYYDYDGFSQFVTEHEFSVTAPSESSEGGIQQTGTWVPPHAYNQESTNENAGLMPWEQDWKHDWQGSLENTIDTVQNSLGAQLPPWLDIDVMKQRSADEFGFSFNIGGMDYSYGSDSGFAMGYSDNRDCISFSIEGITISIPVFWKK